MVKNTCGGSKHKSQARKVVVSGKQNTSLRLAKEEGEVYAQVVKIFGGTLFSALCIDGIARNCVIRGKFRSKRDCMLSPGSWILVGLREYVSTKKDSVETCDLLEVYADSDKEKLKLQQPSLNWRQFVTAGGGKYGEKQDQEDETIRFTDATDEEYQAIVNDELTQPEKAKTTIAFDEDDIDVDDI
jgi:initiation factor 1A